MHTIDMITRSHDILATNILKYAALSHSAYIACCLMMKLLIGLYLMRDTVTCAWLWTEGRLKFHHCSPCASPSIPFPIPFLHLGRYWGVFTIFTLAAVAEPESQPTGEILASAKMEVDFVEDFDFGVFFLENVRPCFSRADIGLKISSAVPG